MITYILHTEKGDRYLSHHGIKGMHWGEWNDETRRRRLGLGTRMKNAALTAANSLREKVEKRNAAIEKWNQDLIHKKDRIWSAEEDCKVVNPFYQNTLDELAPFFDKYGDELSGMSREETESLAYLGAVTNCAACTFVFDLRRRGYDVDATPTTMLAGTYSTDAYKYYEPPLEWTTNKTVEELEKDLEELPDGARGGISGITVNGGGHAIAWEKENGKVTFYDCQSGDTYDFKTLEKIYNVAHDSDDLKMDYKRLKWSRTDESVPKLESFVKYGIISGRIEGENRDTYLDDAERAWAGFRADAAERAARNAVADAIKHPENKESSVDRVNAAIQTVREQEKEDLDKIRRKSS